MSSRQLRAGAPLALAAFLIWAPVPAPAQFPAPPPAVTGPWSDKSLGPDERARLLAARMTIDEKISLLHGGGWDFLLGGPEALPARSLGGAGFIPGVPRLGIPDLQMADAAVGVARSAIFGRYSTPLPSAIAAAASWDLSVAREFGSVIGSELRAQGYNMALGRRRESRARAAQRPHVRIPGRRPNSGWKDGGRCDEVASRSKASSPTSSTTP